MKAFDELNRLAKWRTLLTGWQLGTRPKGDPEADAVRNHRELSLILRAEVSALVAVLHEKNIIAPAEWDYYLAVEAKALSQSYEKKFPGWRAIDDGLEMYDAKAARETMQGWKP